MYLWIALVLTLYPSFLVMNHLVNFFQCIRVLLKGLQNKTVETENVSLSSNP